ncbi:MAG: hypothetical protein ACJ71Q_11140 [Terriglobales bacterium]
MMSLQNKLTAASNREQYIAVLKITLIELADALCRLAYDERLPEPFRIRFKDQGRLHSRIAELWVHRADVWIKEPDAIHLSLPISGTLTSADGRTITLATLE